jgi:hypothetical protein
MAPPEVILDLCLIQLRKEAGCSGYIGRLDIERVEPPSFRSFLYLFKKTMNEALRLENANASGGVQHPPFHLDYLDVSDGTRNAHAFQYNGFAFIVVTLPLVELVLHVSRDLSRSPFVAELLDLNSGTVELDALQALLLQIQLSFLVSHEYTHHVHQHCVESRSGAIGLWTEFLSDATCGSINSQAQELDADGYAAYVVLTHLLRGEMRQRALAELGQADISDTAGDELLLKCFFLSVLAFFCTLRQGDIDIASVYRFGHPPPPVRIKYMLDVSEMWCGQNGSVPQSWFNPEQLQKLFSAAAEVFAGMTRQTWDAQMSFLSSAEGMQYNQQLFERFETIRKNRDQLVITTG